MRSTAMRYARLLLFVSALLPFVALTACARDEEGLPQGRASGPSGDTSPAYNNNASVLSNPDTAGWTAGLTAKPGSAMTTLTEVRTAVHPEFERIVFVFEGDGISGYHAEYIDRPVRSCGSGEVVEMPGDAWLSIRLEPSQAHTEEGAPTIAQRTRAVNYGNLKLLKQTCDFEGQVVWVAAVTSPNRYRTLELTNPSRLVVDIQK